MTLQKARRGRGANGGARNRRSAAASSGRVTQNDFAYETIKDAILALRLKPGEHLNAAQLSERFNIGRTPVNRALHRLKLERLVEILPRKGVAVVPLSLDDAMCLIEVRRINEAHCLELAAERIGAEELDELERLLEAFEAAARHGSTEQLLHIDREFHRTIARASRNPVLVDFLDVLHARSQRFWAMSFSRRQHIDEVVREHRSILASLKQRDASRARDAIIEHIDSFRRNLMQ